MICPYCAADGAKSTLTPGTTSSTCMAFQSGHYDEGGKWIPGRDPNWHTTMYFCSRGHQFNVQRREGEPDVVHHLSTLTVSTP